MAIGEKTFTPNQESSSSDTTEKDLSPAEMMIQGDQAGVMFKSALEKQGDATSENIQAATLDFLGEKRNLEAKARLVNESLAEHVKAFTPYDEALMGAASELSEKGLAESPDISAAVDSLSLFARLTENDLDTTQRNEILQNALKLFKTIKSQQDRFESFPPKNDEEPLVSIEQQVQLSGALAEIAPAYPKAANVGGETKNLREGMKRQSDRLLGYAEQQVNGLVAEYGLEQAMFAYYEGGLAEAKEFVKDDPEKKAALKRINSLLISMDDVRTPPVAGELNPLDLLLESRGKLGMAVAQKKLSMPNVMGIVLETTKEQLKNNQLRGLPENLISRVNDHLAENPIDGQSDLDRLITYSEFSKDFDPGNFQEARLPSFGSESLADLQKKQFNGFVMGVAEQTLKLMQAEHPEIAMERRETFDTAVADMNSEEMASFMPPMNYFYGQFMQTDDLGIKMEKGKVEANAAVYEDVGYPKDVSRKLAQMYDAYMDVQEEIAVYNQNPVGEMPDWQRKFRAAVNGVAIQEAAAESTKNEKVVLRPEQRTAFSQASQKLREVRSGFNASGPSTMSETTREAAIKSWEDRVTETERKVMGEQMFGVLKKYLDVRLQVEQVQAYLDREMKQSDFRARMTSRFEEDAANVEDSVEKAQLENKLEASANKGAYKEAAVKEAKDALKDLLQAQQDLQEELKKMTGNNG